MHSQSPRSPAAASMNRGERTLRGAAIAGGATLTAAASHALGGGEVTAISIFATVVLALPLSIALAGRKFGPGRLTLAVSVAQFVYHWCFAGLGLFASAGETYVPAPLHAAHLAQVQNFVPDLAAAGAAGLAMWLGHAFGAIFTIALLHRGELALRGLLRLARRALPAVVPAAPTPPRLVRIAPVSHVTVLARAAYFSVITHRGPPAAA